MREYALVLTHFEPGRIGELDYLRGCRYTKECGDGFKKHITERCHGIDGSYKSRIVRKIGEILFMVGHKKFMV